jgi:hypothetical protein
MNDSFKVLFEDPIDKIMNYKWNPNNKSIIVISGF